MNRQGATRAGVVSGLSAGYTENETMGYGDFNKNPVYDCAADFSLLNLPKGKSLGRSKPATNS